jgi:anti-anti-sigma factor
MFDSNAKFQVRDGESGCVVLSCQGGLSWEDREQLADHVDRSLRQRGELKGVVMDLAAVEFINSAGLGALFQLSQRLRGQGKRLVFAHVPPAFVRMFHSVGLDRTARVCTDLQSAFALVSTTVAEPAHDPIGDLVRGFPTPGRVSSGAVHGA